MKLSDAAARKAIPREKAYKMADGDGMFLQISPNGSKLWRFKCRYNQKEKLISFGRYPEVTLAKAREKRIEARRLLADNIDPSELPQLIRDIEYNEARMFPTTRLLFECMLHTFARTNELIQACWEEFDIEAARWKIPTEPLI